MDHSIVPCFEELMSQLFQPTAAQEYKTMHKILQYGFIILRKVNVHRMRNVPDYNTRVDLSLLNDRSMSHDTHWLQPLILLNLP